MKISRTAGALFIAVISAVLLHAAPPRIDPRAYLEHIKYLASDELQGRGNGTPGLEKAADYIARQFKAAGLEPAGDNGTFFQRFDLIAGVSIERGNQVTIRAAGKTTALRIGRDYELLSVSPSREPAAALPVVFAGYGISAPAYGYDDYAEVNANGAAVLIFTHEPQENDPSSVFDGDRPTSYSSVAYKTEIAAAHRAKAVLLVDDSNHQPDASEFARWLRDPQADEFGLPVFYLSRDRVQDAIGSTLDFAAVSREIDRDLIPRSRPLSGLSVTAVDRTATIRKPVRNVVGLLRGSDPEARAEAVVVGAHYDHLGESARFSLEQNASGRIHHGADDNASGTAAVIEMAKAVSAARAEFRRSVVFAAFAGEEVGLLGSFHYVRHPAVPLDKTLAMLNLDMVGRANGRILLDGFPNALSLEDDLKAAREDSGSALTVVEGSPGEGNSDDAPFLLRRIPAISFFSGFHADYHRPGDTWEKIDAAGGAAVADLALALARRIANRTARPEFTGPR